MDKDLIKRASFYLEPGYIYCAAEPSTVQTVLGSCVAVCLWDSKRALGGINHFLYPETRDKGRATAQYGNVATLELLRMMEKFGCKRSDILAQILGGAAPMGLVGDHLGLKNVQSARKVLHQKHIRVCSEDVGGHMGRKIVFDSVTGHVAVLKVFELRQHDWITAAPENT